MGYVKVIVFEEEDFIVVGNLNVNYIVVFDLFDGLLNIDINLFVGMIFLIMVVFEGFDLVDFSIFM